MKRFFTLFTTVVVFLSAHAQEHVYYLLPNSYDWNCEEVTNVYDNKSEGSHKDQNQLQWEALEWTTGNNDCSPERRAYEWFKNTYCGQDPKTTPVWHVITYKDLTDGRLEANGNLFSSVKVLWVNVDRYMDVGALDGLFPSGIRDRLANYVKAGGNLYLSTYASRLVYLIGRGPEPGFEENNGFADCSTNDPWLLLVNFGEGYDYHQYRIFKPLNDNSKYGRHGGKAYDTYVMQSSSTKRTNRNCLWDIDNNTGAVSSFQTTHTCKVLGSWGHESYFTSAGLVEFYPVGDWKGTVICNGLAACSFAPTNDQKANVQYLTKGILDYLSTPVSLSISVKENPVIKDEEYIGVTKSDNLKIISYASTNYDIADIHDVRELDAGKIFYNYFGDVTFTVTAEGDGENIPKNTVSASINRTVRGGESAQYAYVLPYSIHTISDMNYEDGTNHNIPDFLSALWFYEHYIKEGRTENYGNGCFINPKNYSGLAAIPSEIQVLWVHNDHVSQGSDDLKTAFGGDNFVAALQAFINRGGNVFLSKQATRLLGDLRRLGGTTYPSYANGGYVDKTDDWGIKNKFFTGDDIVNYSTHPVYKDLGENPQLIDAEYHTYRTNNNDILFDATYNKSSLQTYETDNNCRLLGSWNNGGTEYQSGVFAEFLPQSTGQGTIIMLGAAAYQWTCGTQTAILDNVHANVKNLTQNILEYLSTATVVVTKPNTPIPSTVNDLVVYQGGSVSNPGKITINNSITYIRPAVGGAAGNELGHWYTFCLPFTPSAVKVHDEGDGIDYPINSVYLNDSDGDTSNNPQGAGHFYLQTFDYYDEEDTHWAYIRNLGKPSKDTPYIIKFLNATEDNNKGSALAEYFTANPVIKFIGGAQEISGNEDGTGGLATGDFSFHVNKTLRKLELTNIYPLNTATNMFEYDYGGTSTIMPFECYIKASTPALAAARPRIMIGRKATQDTNITTSIENPTAESHSPVFVYDLMGRRCYEGMPQTLPSGIWIVRQGEMSKTIVIP